MKKTFGVAGGGARAAELVRLLKRDGYSVSACGVETESPVSLETALKADVVILPVPLCNPGGTLNCPGAEIPATELLAKFRRGQDVFAGLVPNEIKLQAQAAGIRLRDYMEWEPMAIANAAATADAALCLTVGETRDTLAGKRCLVLGFGRIGKLLCQRLRGAGADAAAAARNPNDRAWIRALGYAALDISRLAGRLAYFQIVYNTVPAPILGAELLRELPPDCFLMDLASKAGIDADAASGRGLSCVWARGLPGKVVPRGAAAILRDTALSLLK